MKNKVVGNVNKIINNYDFLFIIFNYSKLLYISKNIFQIHYNALYNYKKPLDMNGFLFYDRLKQLNKLSPILVCSDCDILNNLKNINNNCEDIYKYLVKVPEPLSEIELNTCFLKGYGVYNYFFQYHVNNMNILKIIDK